MGVRDLNLKWRLLISFLLLTFIGTTILVWIGVRSQRALIRMSERNALLSHYQHFLQSIQEQRDQALSLATAIAMDPRVQEAFARGDRKALLDHLLPIFRKLKEEFRVLQVHFHKPPAFSFLRIHRPDRYGEYMESYRPTILYAIQTQRGVGGLEWGDTGYAIRGVVPIEYEGVIQGTVEVGFSFADAFVQAFKAQYGVDLTLYVPERPGAPNLIILATTLAEPRPLGISSLRNFKVRHQPLIWMPLPGKQVVSGLLGPVRGFTDQIVALVEIRIDRMPILSRLDRYRTEMIIVEIVGMLLAILVVWFVVHRFLLPVREMVRGAAEIASGERLYMPVTGKDEMGQLARALNNMVGYLEASRQRTKDYARNLEEEVQARTRELQFSEEKYRTLVERVPLVVYQMTPDRTLTFLNRFSSEMLGVDPADLLETPGALDRLVHSEDRDRVITGFQKALAEGREWIAEYRMETPQGRIVYVREHAKPTLDSEGNPVRVDGILVNATDQKKLQETILQAEELRTLGEVAARLAHEIRNPLTSIGGLSRRLLRDLPEDHAARPWIKVIVDQVRRLEGILQMILSYIAPVEVHLVPGDLGKMLEALCTDLAREFHQKNRDLSWIIPSDLPQVPMDRALLRKAMENLCRHTLFFMDQGGGLDISAAAEDDRLRIRLCYRTSKLSKGDLDQYFYPFLSQDAPDPALLDLPVAKIILHKHGGLVHVQLGEDNKVILDLILPVAQQPKSLRQPEIR